MRPRRYQPIALQRPDDDVSSVVFDDEPVGSAGNCVPETQPPFRVFPAPSTDHVAHDAFGRWLFVEQRYQVRARRVILDFPANQVGYVLIARLKPIQSSRKLPGPPVPL